jgi:NTE family protein
MKVNAVFEGGGVKAIALVGAVKATEEKGVTFARLAGTSSGSIVASLLAAGYTADELKSIITSTPFSHFLRKSFVHHIKVIGPLCRLFVKKGLYPGDDLEEWIAKLLAAKGISTFDDLEPGKLRIVASDISQGKMLVLPDDIEQYGISSKDFPVHRAIRMSTSIPFFFDPVVLHKSSDLLIPLWPWAGKPKWKEPIFIVDGALLSSFPLWLFDTRAGEPVIPTFGYHLVGKSGHSVNQIRGPISMFQALLATMLDAHDERYIEMKNRFRTIKVPTLGVRATEFSLSPERSQDLFDSGYQAALEYLESWSAGHYMSEYEKIIRV